MSDLVNFLGPTYQAASPTQDAQEAINWFIEIDPNKAQGERGRFALYPAPGRTLVWQPPAAYGGSFRGLYTLRGQQNFVAVVGAYVYLLQLTNSVVTSLNFGNQGQILPVNYSQPLSTTTGPVSITDNGVQIFIADGVSRYVLSYFAGYGQVASFVLTVTNLIAGIVIYGAGTYVGYTGTNTNIYSPSQLIGSVTGYGGVVGGNQTYTLGFTAVNFGPALIIGWAFGTLTEGASGNAPVDIYDCIDGYVINNISNTANWASTNFVSGVSNPLSFGTKLVSSDNIISIICDHDTVWLLGEKTSEPWNNQHLFPFPFAPVIGAMIQHGCVAKFSVARLGESFAFLAQDGRGVAIVVQMVGYIPERISTHAVETAMAGYSVISDAIAYTYQQAGHEFYVLTFPTADKTWVYDLATELWHKRESRDGKNNRHRLPDNCACVFQGKNYVGDFSNGNLYVIDQSNYTINGLQMPCTRTAQHLTQDLRRVTYNDLQIQFQPGVGISTGQGSNPQAMLKWSDDGGFTWSHEHWTNIGQQGKYKNRAIWRRLGVARDRVFSVSVTDPVFRTIVSAEINATPMNY